jgi:hypothetical protein
MANPPNKATTAGVTATAATCTPGAVADALERSFSRLCWQRIDAGAGRATVMGVRHRRPTRCRVSLSVADELRRRGLTTVVR